MLELTTLQKSIIKRNYRTIESLEKKVEKLQEKIENQRIKFEEKVSKHRLDMEELKENISSFEMPVIEMTDGFTSSQIVNEDTTVPMYIRIDGGWILNTEEPTESIEEDTEEEVIPEEIPTEVYEEEADKEAFEERMEVNEDPFEGLSL